MSGGHFDYEDDRIDVVAFEIERLIENNDEYGDTTIVEFKKAVELLKMSYIYAHRIDWLVSGDDSEETFHERLKKDLEAMNEVKK